MIERTVAYFKAHRTITFWLIFFLAFSIRFPFLVKHRDDIVFVGAEPRIAYSLITQGIYGNPYKVPTGPTAHAVPGFVLLLAANYKLLGTGLLGQFGRCSLLVISGYAALFGLYPTFAEWFGFPFESGLLAGFLSAIFVVRRSFEVFRGWDESWTGIILAGLLYLALRRYRSGRHDIGNAVWWGVCWGVVMYLNFSVLSVLAGLLLVEFLYERSFVVFRNACVTVAVVALIISPWVIRNYKALHGFALMRSNLGLEVYFGNHPGAMVSAELMDLAPDSETAHPHPEKDVSEAIIVQRMGELNYMHRDLHLALSWISEHPGDFLKLTAQRILFFWCGPLNHKLESTVICAYTLLGFIGFFLIPKRVGKLQFRIWCTVFVFYPLMYYIVPWAARYRVPIDWMIWLPAGLLVCVLFEKKRVPAERQKLETVAAP
jgi:hypothetical protein